MANKKNADLLKFANMGGGKGGEPEQLEHPVIKEEIPEVKVETNTDTGISTDIEKFYNPPEKIVKKQVSIYLDTDVIEAFNAFGTDHGKGAKSDLVNNFLKQVFKIRQG